MYRTDGQSEDDMLPPLGSIKRINQYVISKCELFITLLKRSKE